MSIYKVIVENLCLPVIFDKKMVNKKKNPQGFTGDFKFQSAYGDDARELVNIKELCGRVRKDEEGEKGSTYQFAVIVSPLVLKSQPKRHVVSEDMTQESCLLDAKIILLKYC